MNDIFLVERATQLQRLKSAKSGNRVEIPTGINRIGASGPATQLYRAMDKICKIPLGEKKKSWQDWLAKRGLWSKSKKLAEASDGPHLLKDDQREAIEQFERIVVELKLGNQKEPAAAADRIIHAIVQDQANFNGLKPMAFHSEAFAHECLFPTWLNLYIALALPRSDGSDPCCSTRQVKTIFKFLEQFEEVGTSSRDLVGVMTLVANRMRQPVALPLLQRLLDLGGLVASGKHVTSFSGLSMLQDNYETASELLELVRCLTIFETAAYRDQITSTYKLGSESPRYVALPTSIVKFMRTVEGQTDRFSVWEDLIKRLASVIEIGGGIEREFAAILERRIEDMREWLEIVTCGHSRRPLPVQCQRILARMITRTEASDYEFDLEAVKNFARQLAPRLSVLDPAMASFFEKEFVVPDKNRTAIMKSMKDPKRQSAIARQLLAHAEKTADGTKLLSQITVAALMDPEIDDEKLTALGRTVKVLGILKNQGFISSGQLEDLTSDLRNRLPESVKFLGAPYLGASGQTTKLAKLYLALNEECEKFEYYGDIGNFGLTSAAYGKLNRTIEGTS